MELPDEIAISAFTGDNQLVKAALDPRLALSWGLRGQFPEGAQVAAPERDVGPECWRHHSNGWGLILPEPESDRWSDADKAIAKDAPDCVQKLVNERLEGQLAPVFRYDKSLPLSHLRRYFTDRSPTTVRYGQQIGQNATNAVPLYLLIIGTPSAIPWTLQYALNQRHHVGRLNPCPETSLAHYINALLEDWPNDSSSSGVAAVWSVDNGDDMTRQMRSTIGHPLFEELQADAQITVNYLAAGDATITKLLAAIQRHPALIVSTSHGQTRPLDDLDQLGRGVGLPVDQNGVVLDIAELAHDSFPSGAIWYAHACCSAGTHSPSRYKGLLTPDTTAYRVVDRLSALPAQIAPLPLALLGAPNPIRAFVGHVEPTFDWPLSDRETGQVLTTGLITALYKKLYQPFPVGLAFDDYYRGIGLLYAEHQRLIDQINHGDRSVRTAATYARLSASDRESLVLLGDPTVTLRALP